MVQRGDIWWADLGEPRGSRPAFKRPVLVIQNDALNRSQLNTVLVLVLSSNEDLALALGNVLLEPQLTRLPKPSVVNVSAVETLNKTDLLEHVSALGALEMRAVEAGLKLTMGMR